MWFPPINLWSIPKQKRDYMKFTIETNSIDEISAILAALNITKAPAPIANDDELAGPDVPQREVPPAASPKGRKSKGASTPVSGGDNNAHSDAGSNSVMDTAPVSETAVEVDEVVEQATPSTEDVKYGIDDIRRALSELNQDQGLAAAKQALGKFGAARVSDLTEGRYAEFISYCASLRG